MQGGIDALRSVPEHGRPAQLDVVQLAAVRAAILQSPTEHDFGTELWTLKRIGTVIERLHGVRFGQTNVWGILGRSLNKLPFWGHSWDNATHQGTLWHLSKSTVVTNDEQKQSVREGSDLTESGNAGQPKVLRFVTPCHNRFVFKKDNPFGVASMTGHKSANAQAVHTR